MTALPLFIVCALTLLVAAVWVAFRRPGWVVRRPRSVLAAIGAVSLGALATLVNIDPPGFAIGVDPASEPLIRRNDPGLAGYAQATDDFGSDDIYVVAMETDGAFTHANLSALRELHNALRRLPGVARVESLAHVREVAWDPGRELVRVDDFIDEIPIETRTLKALRERALEHPVYARTLISRDARTAAIELTFRPMSDAEFVALDLDGRIAALLAAATTGERRFHVSGRPHIRARAHHTIVRDLLTLVPVAVAVAAAVLWWMARSFLGMAIPLVACLLATLWVYGAMALLDFDVNLITLVIGPMMICLGSVYGVHVLARHRLICETQPDPGAAALATLVYVRTPVAIAGLTTCIGFGALLLADVPATNQLGAFAIIGIAGVTLLSLTGVPAALALLRSPAASPPGRPPRPPGRFSALLDRGLEWIARTVLARPTRVLVFWAFTTTIAVLAIPRISIDTDFISFFRSDSQVRREFDAVNRLLAGAVPLFVTVDGPGEGAFREPTTLRTLERLQSELEALPGVNEVLSAIDPLRLANRALHDGDARFATIPGTRGAVAEAIFLLPKDDLRRFTTSNHSRANLIVRSDRAGSAAVRELEARIREVLDRSDWPPGYRASVTGNTLLLNRSADEIAGNQATQVGLAALAILCLVVAVFRSWRLGAIALVPNIVPVLLYFGILGLGAAPLSIPTSLIGSIALGIAIDDSLHFLIAYRRLRDRGRSPAEAAEACILAVGRPIVMTSIMIVVGFLVILMSGFATLQEFGALTALTMAICLATDLLLLPALLVRLRA